jgi:uncharacterized protein (DUF736 family)
MAQIGTFVLRDGVWQTVIRTLTVHMTVRLVPNAGKRPCSEAPDFHILAGDVKAGAAWRRETTDLPWWKPVFRLDSGERSRPQQADFYANEAEGTGLLIRRDPP